MLTKRANLYILGAFGISVAIVFGLAFADIVLYKVQRMYKPYLDREISGPVKLERQWLEINFKEPLSPERPANEISLVFEEVYEDRVAGRGLQLPNGQLLSPEMQLVDSQGEVFELNQVAALGPRGLSRSMGDPINWKETLPRDRTYRALRIRSDTIVNVTRIFWRSYDPADFK